MMSSPCTEGAVTRGISAAIECCTERFSSALSKQRQQPAFIRAQAAPALGLTQPIQVKRIAPLMPRQHTRVNIGLAADRDRVAEQPCDLAEHLARRSD